MAERSINEDLETHGVPEYHLSCIEDQYIFCVLEVKTPILQSIVFASAVPSPLCPKTIKHLLLEDDHDQKVVTCNYLTLIELCLLGIT